MRYVVISGLVIGMFWIATAHAKGSSSSSGRSSSFSSFKSTSSSSNYRTSSTQNSGRGSSFQQRVNSWNAPSKPMVASTPKLTNPPPQIKTQIPSTTPKVPPKVVNYQPSNTTTTYTPNSSRSLTTGQKVAVGVGVGAVAAATVSQAHAAEPTETIRTVYVPVANTASSTSSEVKQRDEPTKVVTKEQRLYQALESAWRPSCNDWVCGN